MKIKQVRINLIDDVKEVVEEVGMDLVKTRSYTTGKEIKIDENILIRLYAEYKGIEIKNNMKLNNIIKYCLPTDKKKALTELKTGITYDDIKYIPLLTTPAMMKKEINNTRCEYLFIAEQDKTFVELYEKLLSGGLINNLIDEDEIVINKDIIARLGLGLSSSFKIDYVPNMVILPSDTYKYTAKYITLNKEKNALINYDESYEDSKFEFADGCGFISSNLCKKIQETKELDYEVDFVGLRLYNATATKGLVIKADWNKYFSENYIETEYFKKDENGDFFTLDYFGNMVNISKADLILNTNMCKWAKLWKKYDNVNDINKQIEDKLNEEEYKKYKDILESVYVTQTNKKSIKSHTQMSYQVLNNTALLAEEIEEMSKESERYLFNISKCDPKDEISLHSAKLYFGDIARGEEYKLSASTKVHRLLQINNSFLATKNIRGVINKNIRKTAHEFAGGKFYMKGRYQTAMICPITYLNWIMTRDVNKSAKLGGLGEGEFYVPREVGQRVLTRNPLAVFSEVHRINLVANEKMDKYFGNITNELIFFNQQDNTAFVSSGQDFDLDFNGVWENETLYNAVIEPKDGRHFYNTEDGDAYSVKYSLEDKYKCILLASGNIIGSISNVTTKISNIANIIGYRVAKTGNEYSWKELKDKWLDKDANIDLKNELKRSNEYLDFIKQEKKESHYITEEEIERNLKNAKENLIKVKLKIKNEFDIFLNEKIELGKIIDIKTLSKDEKRTHIINNYYKNLYPSYYALYLALVAIDAPKTCKFPSDDEMLPVKEYKELRYPSFMYHSKYSENFDSEDKIKFEDTIFTGSALDINAVRVAGDLIKHINKMKNSNDNPFSFIELLKEFAVENEECNGVIENEYKKYKEERKEIHERYSTYNVEDDIKKKNKYNKNLEYNNIDSKFLTIMEAKESLYKPEELAFALLGCNTDFISKICWNTVSYIINLKDREVKMYVEDEKGDIDYMFNKYKEVDAILKEDKLQQMFKEQLDNKIVHNFNVKTNSTIEVEDGSTLVVKKESYFNKRLDKDIEQAILYTEDGERVGFVYDNTSNLKDGRIIKDFEKIIVKNIKAKSSGNLFLQMEI